MSRFFLLSAGQMVLPAKCHSCGSCDTDRQYIDIQLQIEFYGSVYICTFCFVTVAEQVGYVQFIAVKYLEEQLEVAKVTIKELTKKDEQLSTVLGLFNSQRVYVGFDGVPPVPVADESSSESEEGAVVPTNGKGSNKSRSRKGSDNVLAAPADSDDGADADIDFADPE